MLLKSVGDRSADTSEAPPESAFTDTGNAEMAQDRSDADWCQWPPWAGFRSGVSPPILVHELAVSLRHPGPPVGRRIGLRDRMLLGALAGGDGVPGEEVALGEAQAAQQPGDALGVPEGVLVA